MDHAFDLAAFRVLAQGVRVVRATQFDDVAVGVLDHLVHARDAGAAQAHFAAGHQALPALGRHLGEILALDPQFARERHLALAEGFVLGMVGEREHFLVPLGQVGQRVVGDDVVRGVAQGDVVPGEQEAERRHEQEQQREEREEAVVGHQRGEVAGLVEFSDADRVEHGIQQ